MVGLVMFAKVFAGTMKASLHRGYGGIESFGDFGMTAALLHKGEKRAILRAKLAEGMAEGVEFLGIHRPGGLGDIFVLLTKGQKNAPEFLAAELVNTGVAREAKQPRFKLGRRLQPVDGTHHFDKDLLGQILDIITPVGHRKNETCDAMLIGDNELPLGGFFALLSPANEVGQRGRGG
jgi:hypothetical protein